MARKIGGIGNIRQSKGAQIGVSAVGSCRLQLHRIRSHFGRNNQSIDLEERRSTLSNRAVWGIIGRLIDSRSDVSALAQTHPDTAERFRSLIAEINSHFHNNNRNNAESTVREWRREARKELYACK